MSKGDPLAARAELERAYHELGLNQRPDGDLPYALDDHLRIARLLLRQRREYYGRDVSLDAGLLSRALGTPVGYCEAIVAYIRQFPEE